ncbi:MAG: hypothetical protein LBB08_00705 [Rickettsiales bacterium]|nr:hypothetical protein [Rickettsiales bacterium]
MGDLPSYLHKQCNKFLHSDEAKNLSDDNERYEVWLAMRGRLEKQYLAKHPEIESADDKAEAAKLAAEQKLAEIRAKEEAYREGCRLTADKLRAAQENKKKEAERIRRVKAMRTKAVIASASLAIAGIAYCIYDKMPVVYKNVADQGKVIYWRTLSGREGIIGSGVSPFGSHVQFKAKNGEDMSFTWYPGSSPFVPADREADWHLAPFEEKMLPIQDLQRTR